MALPFFSMVGSFVGLLITIVANLSIMTFVVFLDMPVTWRIVSIISNAYSAIRLHRCRSKPLADIPTQLLNGQDSTPSPDKSEIDNP